MNRRTFIGASAAGLAGIAITESCGGKSVSGAVTVILGGIAELKLIYPNLAILEKIAKLGASFNNEWVAGKFDSARTTFEALDKAVLQVISDLQINASPQAKLALASLGVGVRLIAALIFNQAQSQPGAMATAQAGAPKTVDRVKQLANAADADWILRATQK